MLHRFGRDREQAGPQLFRLPPRRLMSLKTEQLHPCGHLPGQERDPRQPLVLRPLRVGQVAQAGVLRIMDPILAPGASPMPLVQHGDVRVLLVREEKCAPETTREVRGEQGVLVPSLLADLPGTGVQRLTAYEQAGAFGILHLRIPPQHGDLCDVPLGLLAAVVIARLVPRPLWQGFHCGLGVHGVGVGDGELVAASRCGQP